jgi:hypothetical protein
MPTYTVWTKQTITAETLAEAGRRLRDQGFDPETAVSMLQVTDDPEKATPEIIVRLLTTDPSDDWC